QGDAVGVLLQRGADHVLDRAVVAEVDHFRALGLDQAAHDVDRGVVAVEQAGGGDGAQWRRGVRLRRGGGLGGCVVHPPIVAPPPGPFPYSASSKMYSCWPSRTTSLRTPSWSASTNGKPSNCGSMVTKA